MNKKLFASALFAVAAFVSSIASAQLTYDNSNTDALGLGFLQDSNPKVAPGGAVVAGNVLVIKVNGNAGTQIPKDAEIIIRLPAGLNFSGTPSYLVTPGTATIGLTLKDPSEFGDPTLDNPKITMFDANGDGGMDRVLVTAAAAGLDSDTLTITANVTASASTTAGTKKASIIVNGGLAVTQDIVEVVSGFTTPVFSASGTKLTSIDQTAQTATVSAAKFTVTIPKGTAGATKLTMTPQSKLTFSSSGTTVTYTVSTPLKYYPFTVGTPTGTFAAGAGTASISFTVTGTASYSLPADTQVTFTVNEVAGQSGGSTGTRGLTLSGIATGTAALVDVKANGSSAKLTSGAANKAVDMVAGSSVEQTLPTVDITENFDGDAITKGGTGTITITPGTGLKFGATNTIAVTGTGWSLVAPTASISSTATGGKLTLTLQNNVGGSLTVTVSGIKATATSSATGDLSMTVGSPGSPDKSNAPNNSLVVAKALPLGTVTVAGPKTLSTTGPGAATLSSTITFKETTYGALSKAAETQVQDAFFRITPNAADISAILISYSGYTANLTPTIGVTEVCAAENAVTTGAWICRVEAESQKVAPGTSTISIEIGYKAKSTAAVGSKITMTVDGNANVSGSADVANVGLATTATKGEVPDLTPGSTESNDFAKVTITEKFTGAVTAGGEFRLLAPQGVAFQDATATASASPGIATATITATFNPNDTLVMTTKTTATVVFTPRGILASGKTGFQSFTLIDGNIEGKHKAGISGQSIMLAYGDGTLEDLDAGENASVNVGFTTTNTVEGGLNMGDYVYSVKSSDATIGSPTISAAGVVTVTAKKAGNATITVTDGLGATDSYVVTVSAGATQPDATKGAIPSSSTATFKSGASSDGGTSYATEFTTADDVTLVGTVNIAAADQGKDGEIYVAVLSKFDSGSTVLAYIDEAGNPQTWDQTIAGLGSHIVAAPLGASYNVIIHSGTLAAGTYRVALAYSTEDGDFVYTDKAMVITVTE
jgi:hypothetical protein